MPQFKGFNRPTYRGGGGVLLHDKDGTEVDCPQHNIDLALTQAALRKIRARMIAQYASGDQPSFAVKSWYGGLKQTCRAFGRNPYYRMSKGMRVACIKTVGPEVYERILKANTNDTTPEVLKHLPKKPPMRKVEE